MMALDASKRDVCTVRRERTDSPAQSLILLNGTQFVEAARAFADHLILSQKTDEPQSLIRSAFHQLTSRPPGEKELAILTRLLSEQIEHFSDPTEAEKFLKVGYYKHKSKDSGHLAAVTSLVSVLMNFDETLSKDNELNPLTEPLYGPRAHFWNECRNFLQRTEAGSVDSPWPTCFTRNRTVLTHPARPNGSLLFPIRWTLSNPLLATNHAQGNRQGTP